MKERIITHMKGKYAIQQKWVRACLIIIDGLLGILMPRKKQPIPPPNSLLLIMPNHLGDSIILTSHFATIKNSFPKVRISLLIGSWNLPVLKNHPDIATIHTYNHWRHNRSKTSIPKKIWHHITTGIRALVEIRKASYDIAVVLSPFFSNGTPISFFMGVPVRIGYDCGGFGPLLTHPVKGPQLMGHITQYHTLLFQQVTNFQPSDTPLKPHIPVRLNQVPFGTPSDYILINIGAGASFKKWPIKSWKSLVKQLQSNGYHIVLAGLGSLEANEVKEIEQSLPSKRNIYNFCNKLSWDDLVITIKHAKLVICHDSVSGHLASCFFTPNIILFSGVRSAVTSFKPLNPRLITMCKPLPCNPCFTVRKGCKTMACIREITVQEVWGNILSILPTPMLH